MTPIPIKVRLESSFTSKMMTFRAMAIMATVNTTSTCTVFLVRYIFTVSNNSTHISTNKNIPNTSNSSLISSKNTGGVIISFMIIHPNSTVGKIQLTPSSPKAIRLPLFQPSPDNSYLLLCIGLYRFTGETNLDGLTVNTEQSTC